jgi:hypothetical protein
MSRLRCRAVLGLTLLLLLPVCARDPSRENGVWHGTRAGFRIAEPAAVGGPDSAWERFDLEGAALAFRRGKLETMSLQARCGRPVTSPVLLARQLVIGIPERTLRQAGPVVVAGQSGWTQTLDVRFENRTARLKTVTLVAGGCAYDLMLVANGEFEPVERVFDAWVDSFALSGVASAGGAP